MTKTLRNTIVGSAVYFLMTGILISQTCGQTAKSQTGYIPPFRVDDPKQQANNESFSRDFMLKKLPVTDHKPTVDEITPYTINIDTSAGNVILWIMRGDSKLYGIDLSTYPLTDDQ